MQLGGVNVEPLMVEIGRVIARIFTAVLIFVAFWVGGKILEKFLCRISAHHQISPDLIFLLTRTAKAALIILGLVTALGTAGVNVAALVAGLGLTGFALGFAFHDMLSNVLAGVLVLLYRPFVRDDRISVSGLEGTVSRIDLRYTVLRSESKTILIPNSNLFTNPIVVTRPDS